MANKYDQSMGSGNDGSARHARPALAVDRIVFVFCLIAAAFYLGYVAGDYYANGVCKITCER